MKANELTTHCFVYFNCFDGSKIIVRVTGFKDGIVYGDSETGSHWCNIEDVEPIPLTTEILEKNGFVNKDNEWVHYCDFPFIDFMLNKDSIGFYIDCLPNVPINYVHELQHAFKLFKVDGEIII